MVSDFQLSFAAAVEQYWTGGCITVAQIDFALMPEGSFQLCEYTSALLVLTAILSLVCQLGRIVRPRYLKGQVSSKGVYSK